MSYQETQLSLSDQEVKVLIEILKRHIVNGRADTDQQSVAISILRDLSPSDTRKLMNDGLI